MPAKPITVRGETFKSYQACADHFGISRVTVQDAVNRDKVDTIGMGRRLKRLVKWDGKVYGVEELAEKTGRAVKTIYNTLNLGKKFLGKDLTWSTGYEAPVNYVKPVRGTHTSETNLKL